MFRPLLIVAALVALSACGKEETPADTDTTGEPQIATSLDDYALPVDRSGQVTAIDATTGDASGMPKDGGAVVSAPKSATRPEVAAPADNALAALPSPSPSPVIAMPPPPAPAAPVTAGD